jgi:tetratricopeptide (TPR) repeat protein
LQAALESNRRSAELDPLRLTPKINQALILAALRRYEEAKAGMAQTIEMYPHASTAYRLRSLIQMLQGDTAGAVASAQESDSYWQTVALAQADGAAHQQPQADTLLKKLIDEDGSDGASQIAEVFAARGEPNAAFEWLEQARAGGDSGVFEMRFDALLLRYKNDPRFLAIGRKIGVIGPQEIP